MAKDIFFDAGFDFSEIDRFQDVNLKHVFQLDDMISAMMNTVGFTLKADAVEMIQQGPTRSGNEYTRGGKRSRRSAKGQPAKTDTGALASSLFAEVLGNNDLNVGYLESIAPHGKYLEDVEEYDLDRQVLFPTFAKNVYFIESQKNKLAKDILKLVTS